MFRRPRQQTLKAGSLETRVSRCSVCIRRRTTDTLNIPDIGEREGGPDSYYRPPGYDRRNFRFRPQNG